MQHHCFNRLKVTNITSSHFYSSHELKIEELKNINEKFRRTGDLLRAEADQLRTQVKALPALSSDTVCAGVMIGSLITYLRMQHHMILRLVIWI